MNAAAKAIFLGALCGCGRLGSSLAAHSFVAVRSTGEHGLGFAQGGERQIQADKQQQAK